MPRNLYHVHLKHFDKMELIFDNNETVEILIFFFPQERHLIESAEIDDSLRDFAQGLIVAAIDASYAMGWIEVVFKSAANPRSEFKKVLKKLAINSTMYLFKDIKNTQELTNIIIYDSVRHDLSMRFRSVLLDKLWAKTEQYNSPLIASLFLNEANSEKK